MRHQATHARGADRWSGMLVALFLAATALPAQEKAESELAVEAKLKAAYGEVNVLAKPKASQKHDRVTVVINESTTAKHEVKLDMKRDNNNSWDLAKWFTLEVDKEGNINANPRLRTTGTTTNDPNRVVKAPNLEYTTAREQKSDGSTESNQTFKSRISGEVVDVLPNGHLVVEARSSVKVNDEDRTMVFTGRIDPKDLDADSAIDANKVIDKEIKLTGKGDLSRNAKRGWGSRILDALNPF